MLKALVRDSAIYSLATLLSRGLVILMVPFYTRVLSPADFGVLELITIMVVLVNLVVPLEIGQGLARFWNEVGDDDQRARLASTAQLFSLCMYVLFLLAGLSFADDLAAWFLGSAAHAETLRVGLVLSAVNGLFFSLQNQFRWLLQARDYAYAAILHGVLLAGLSLMLAHVMQSPLLGILSGQALAALAAGLFACLKLRRWWRPVLVRALLGRMLGFAWPLAISGIATYASLYAGRLVLNHLSSLEDVARYGLATRLAGLVVFLLVGVQGALTPLIYAHHEKPETPGQLAVLFSGFVAVALFACLGMAVFAVPLVAIFGTADYAGAAPLLGILAPAVILTQLYVFAPGIAIAKKSLWQLAIFVASAVVCVTLSYWLIPAMGLAGAAWASLGSGIVFLGAWLAASQRLYPVPFAWSRLVVASMVYILLVLVDACLLPAQSWSSPLVLLCKSGLLVTMMATFLALGLLRWRDLRHVLNRN